jgi:hypothetical protein
MARLISIYCNDHLTAATGAVELAKRVRGSNAGTPLGDYAAELAAELEAEREALRAVMRRAGMREDPIKRTAGLVAERLGRLKLNGQLRGYSPLSRLVEIEALLLLAAGSVSLWRTLGEAGHDAGDWAARAERRIAALHEHRAAAVAPALDG